MWFCSGWISVLVLCVGAARGAWQESTVVPVRVDASRGGRAYRLDAFGQRLLLRLQPDHSFLAPGFVFSVAGAPEPPRGGPEPPSGGSGGSRAEPGCFFSGTVNGEERSAAALNLCGGLTGGFFLLGEEYFIQPRNSSNLREEQQEEHQEEEEEVVHVVRRRSRAALAEEGSSKCGVSEDEERVPRNLEGGDKGGQTGETGLLLVFIYSHKQTNNS